MLVPLEDDALLLAAAGALLVEALLVGAALGVAVFASDFVSLEEDDDPPSSFFADGFVDE